MTVLGVIPARYASTRFPGKPLAPIAGKPMVQHVYERVCSCAGLSGVVVATDDERIRDCVTGFGGRVVMTRADHQSGTDRLGEVAGQERHAYYVNIQGDEPLIKAEAIDRLIAETQAQVAVMSTLACPLDPVADAATIQDPNVVKVARAQDGYALYFSRAPIPYPRNSEHARYHKHIGIYMYMRQTLLELCKLPPSPLELAESLEQLRAMEHGVPILAVETDYSPVGVDVPADIELAEARLRELEG